MLLAGLDFETTGLDPETDVIIEVGVALFDTDIRQIVRCENFFVKSDGLVIPEHITNLTGITAEMCLNYGRESSAAFKYLTSWLSIADAVVAHNAPFDRKFLMSWARSLGHVEPDNLWLDTKADLDDQIPERYSRKLVYLAADHGMINPFPHRALFDVTTMLRILDQYDIEHALQMARTPNVLVQAIVSYDDREKAKALGFHWRKEGKIWAREVKECFVERERERASAAGVSIEVHPLAS